MPSADSSTAIGDPHESLSLARDTTKASRGKLNLYRRQSRHDVQARLLVTELLRLQMQVAESSTNAAAKNKYAWLALTCEPADLRDPESALRFALEANQLTKHENSDYLDTLSLAYHLTRETAKAIENQKKAISLLPEGESALRKNLEEALAKFEAALKAGSD